MPIRRSMVLLSALVVMTGPARALAAPPPGEAPGQVPPEGEAPDSPEYLEAQRLFDLGVAHYEVAEYDQAITAWVQAHAMLPHAAEHRQIRAELVYNIAAAQRKAFDIDGDVRHLKQAERSLEGFVEEIPDIYEGDDAAQETAKAKKLLDELEAQVLAADRKAHDAEVARDERLRPKFDPVVDAREHKRNRAMIISGATLTALGLASFGMMTAGLLLGAAASQKLETLDTEEDLDERRDLLAQGRTFDALAISGIALGGALSLTGIPVLATGATFERRRKKYKANLGGGFSRTGANLFLHLRF